MTRRTARTYVGVRDHALAREALTRIIGDMISWPAERTDVIVVGAGIIGLATTFELMQRGIQVRCIEKGVVGAGQSAGETRLFRHQHDSDELVDLAVHARSLWQRWEATFNVELVGTDGALLADTEGLKTMADRLSGRGVDCVVVDRAEQQALFPHLSPPSDVALYDRRGGAIRADAAIEMLRRAVEDHVVRAEVFGIEAMTEDRATVATSEGTVEASAVLVCAGADTPRLASALDIEIPVRRRWHVCPTFTIQEGFGAGMCWQDRTGAHGDRAYGSPCVQSRGFALALAEPDADLPFNPTGYSPEAGKVPAMVRRIEHYVERALPGIAPRARAVRLCLVASLPSGSDSFAAWRRGPILFFAGHSLFKMAPAIGELLADAAQSRAFHSLLVPDPADLGG